MNPGENDFSVTPYIRSLKFSSRTKEYRVSKINILLVKIALPGEREGKNRTKNNTIKGPYFQKSARRKKNAGKSFQVFTRGSGSIYTGHCTHRLPFNFGRAFHLGISSQKKEGENERWQGPFFFFLPSREKSRDFKRV